MNPVLPLRILFPLFLLLSVVVAAVSSFLYMLPEDNREVEEKSIENVKQIMNLLHSSVNILIRRNDTDGIRIQLNSLTTDHRIKVAILVDEQGNELVSGHNEHQGVFVEKIAPFIKNNNVSYLDNLHGGKVSLSEDRQNIRAIYPVYLSEQYNKLRSTRIGFLLYEKFIGHDKIIDRNKELKHVSIFVLLIFFISALLWLIFNSLITRRTNRLLDVTKQLASGELSVRTGLQGRDEFAGIGQALDVMAEKLNTHQHELASSEQRLRTSQAFANIGSWEYNIVTGNLFWSETIASMFGFGVNKIQPSHELFINSVHPDDRELLEQAIQKCLDENEIYDIQHRIVWPDGTIRWMHEKGDVVRDDLGNPLRFLGIVRDITEQKTIDARLHKSIRELHYQKDAIDQHSIVVVTDLDGVITYANSRFSDVSGYSNEELVGQTHELVNSGFHPKTFFHDLWQTISDGNIWQAEVCNRKKNGEIYWVDTTIVPHFDDKGMPDNYTAIRADITERKKNDAQLHVQSAALNAAVDGIVITDKDGLIQWVNPAFTHLTGYHFDESVGQNTKILLKTGKNDYAFYKNMWEKIISGMTWQGELWSKRKDGKLYLEEQSITPILDQAGKIEHIIFIKRDISERQQLQEQLQQAQKMEAIGQLTGGIAHDFNNMLVSIMGYTQLANEGVGQQNPKVIKDYLNEVFKSSTRARDLVAQMLAFSRGVEGELKPHVLVPLLKESLKMLGSTLPSSIEMDIQLNDNELSIMTNPVHLHQLVMNLCINARDAMNGQGSMTIRLEQVTNVVMVCRSCHEKVAGDYIMLSFQDTGTGIKPEQLDSIFNPFFTTKDVGKGSGMGLSMVHGIMHDHGGHITVETGAGKGTTFTLLFPLIDAQVEAVRDEDNETMTLSDQMFIGNILIVDDEASVGNFIAELLKVSGCSVTVETDSHAALLLFKENPSSYDLVVTDQTMPGLTGVELAQSLLEIRPQLPVILCTGYSDNTDEAQAKSLGIKGYFNKPLDNAKLINLIKQLLQACK